MRVMAKTLFKSSIRRLASLPRREALRSRVVMDLIATERFPVRLTKSCTERPLPDSTGATIEYEAQPAVILRGVRVVTDSSNAQRRNFEFNSTKDETITTSAHPSAADITNVASNESIDFFVGNPSLELGIDTSPNRRGQIPSRLSHSVRRFVAGLRVRGDMNDSVTFARTNDANGHLIPITGHRIDHFGGKRYRYRHICRKQATFRRLAHQTIDFNNEGTVSTNGFVTAFADSVTMSDAAAIHIIEFRCGPFRRQWRPDACIGLRSQSIEIVCRNEH